MVWVGVIHYEKCNYYVFVNCIRRTRGEFIQNYCKIFRFLMWSITWDPILVDQ